MCYFLVARSFQTPLVTIGDAFVPYDAGGVAVDRISYEVTKLDPLELSELVPGTGNDILF